MPLYLVRKHTVESQLVRAPNEREASERAVEGGEWDAYDVEIETERYEEEVE
jgi:hypothetical protein